MANTVTVNQVLRGTKQFQGAFSEMWTIKATIADQDAVAINDTLLVTMAVPGVALGDMVLGVCLDVDYSDGTDQAIVTASVTAADVVSLQVHADVGELAADALTNGVLRVLVGRPTW